MQVNSAQDYLTLRKRQLISATHSSTPPEQKDKTNAVYISTVANRATTQQILAVPATSAWGHAPGGTTITNWCSGCEAFTGVFPSVNTKDVVSRQALRPIGTMTQ